MGGVSFSFIVEVMIVVWRGNIFFFFFFFFFFGRVCVKINTNKVLRRGGEEEEIPTKLWYTLAALEENESQESTKTRPTYFVYQEFCLLGLLVVPLHQWASVHLLWHLRDITTAYAAATPRGSPGGSFLVVGWPHKSAEVAR